MRTRFKTLDEFLAAMEPHQYFRLTVVHPEKKLQLTIAHRIKITHTTVHITAEQKRNETLGDLYDEVESRLHDVKRIHIKAAKKRKLEKKLKHKKARRK